MGMPKQHPGVSKQELADLAISKYWKFVSIQGPEDCWPWTAGQCAGYGILYLGGGRINGINEYAHRLSLYYATKVWGQLAMHSCDNRLCCNPTHLSWATHKDNSQDALKKGRMYVGEANSNNKLSTDTVYIIRGMHAMGRTQREIAIEVGAKLANVNAICIGRSRKNG